MEADYLLSKQTQSISLAYVYVNLLVSVFPIWDTQTWNLAVYD